MFRFQHLSLRSPQVLPRRPHSSRLRATRTRSLPTSRVSSKNKLATDLQNRARPSAGLYLRSAPGGRMFNPKQYRDKAAEYSERAKTANGTNETREFEQL